MGLINIYLMRKYRLLLFALDALLCFASPLAEDADLLKAALSEERLIKLVYLETYGHGQI